MPKMKQVWSSHIETIGYEPETKELHVVWDTGKTSVYHDVQPDVANDVMSAPSIGKALHKWVKDKHEHSYL